MIAGKVKTEKEYRQLDKDSSSSLKEFSLDRRKYFKKHILREVVEDEDESKASVVGRLVETLLFEEAEFDNKFCLSTVLKAPTGKMLDFVEALYKHTKLATDEDGNINRSFEDLAKDARVDSGFEWSLEVILKKFIGTDAEIYYKEIREIRTRGLTPIVPQDLANAEKIVEELKSNEFTAPIIGLLKNDDSRYEILIQHKVEDYEVDGLPMKSMMDLIVIDHKEKTIQVYDLKCVWSVEGFFKEYYLYRRAYIQAYVYKEAARTLKSLDHLDHYTVLNPKFIVCDSINYYSPLIYSLENSDINEAYSGFTYEGKTYPGVKEIVADLKWAKENNRWNVSRKNYLNNGIVNIKG